MNNETKHYSIVMLLSISTLLFVGWVMLGMPSSIVEHRYVAVENTTVIKDPVILELNDLEFEEAFYIMRVAKGTYSDFYWNGILYNTCYEEEAAIAPDRCKGVLTYLNQERIAAWQKTRKED